MIKLITKIFKGRHDYDKSEVVVELDLPKETKEELFDKAVREVVRKELGKKIKKQLSNMCYTEEQIAQTEEYFNRGGSTLVHYEIVEDLKKEFPEIIITQHGHSSFYDVGPVFCLDEFVNKIIEKGIEE